MADICEVCGKVEGEDTSSMGLMQDTLHVCEQCRRDRQTGGDEIPSVQG